MPAFRTIGDVLGEVREQLQDTDATLYRYTDLALVQALNMGLLETRRIRPDLFRGRLDAVPQYTTADLGNGLAIEPMYVPVLIYYIVGMAQLRDSEEATDARAVQFLATFGQKMVGSPS